MTLGKPKPVKPAKTKKRHPKSERRKLEDELWKLTADYVKRRDGHCVTCGEVEMLTLSHWIKAGKQIVRYDLRNCNAQCPPCNNAHNYYTYHYDNYMLRHWGKDVMLELTGLAISHDSHNFRWSVLDLREMIEERKAQLEEL